MTTEKNKTLFVCVDSDEDTHLYIADNEAVERYWKDHPLANIFEVATEIGRELTPEEIDLIPFDIMGALAY